MGKGGANGDVAANIKATPPTHRPTGGFAPGNKLGGNPYGGRIYAIKRAILDSASPEDVTHAMGRLRDLWDELTDDKKAFKYEPNIRLKALQEWLNRVAGKPDASVEEEGGDAQLMVMRQLLNQIMKQPEIRKVFAREVVKK